MPKIEENLSVECQLTADEKLTYSKELAESINSKRRSEDSLTAFKSQVNSEIKGFEAKINLLSQKISSGTEYREVPCRIEYDWNGKTRCWIRIDTGEEVKNDIIPEAMYQKNLELGD